MLDQVTSSGPMLSPDCKTILVVDDYEPVCELIELLLSRIGYRVLKASNGARALRLAASAPIDLLLSNFNLPGMRGDELAVRFAMIHPSVPVVFLSIADHRLDLTEEQVVLFKPFTMLQLRDAVSRAIHSGNAGSG
jgi:CheY-like chemotaxis protein